MSSNAELDLLVHNIQVYDMNIEDDDICACTRMSYVERRQQLVDQYEEITGVKYE